MSRKSDATPAKRPHQVSTRAQIERVFGIAAMIQNDDEATVGKLAARFEVDRRTILRDIGFLRDRLGVGIEFDREEGRYILDSDFAHIPPMELTDTDFLLLSYLQQCIAPYADTDIGKMMLTSFDRLFGLLTGTKRWREFARTVLFRFDIKPGSGTQKEVRIFNLLHRAIKGAKEVRFTYKPQRKPSATRTVEPRLLTMYHGRWYLYGVDTAKKSLGLFAFARIEDVEATGRTFSPDESAHNPRELLRHSFGVAISAELPVDVVLEFEKEVAQRVQETVWHPLQKLCALPGGRARLTMPLSTTLEVRPWILSWGPYVKVVSPQELADKIADTVHRMSERYS